MDQGMNALAMVRRNPIITMSVVLLAISIAMLSLPQIRWRVHVLLLHVSGKIPDIALGEVVTFMMPGSSQSMARLIETRNPHALIKNFHTSERDVAAGGRLYREQCAECHAPDGSGGPGAPSLVGREFTHGADDWAIYRSIRLGIAKTAMQPHPIGSTQLWQIVAFLRSIDTRDRGARSPDVAWRPTSDVSPAELAAISTPRQDWLTYSGSYSSTRHSALTQIRPDNVRELGLRWIFAFPGEPGKVETTPIVRQGQMFVTVPPGLVISLNAVTGKIVWSKQYLVSGKAAGGEFGGATNRGVAILDDRIFVGTGDAHLVARSAATGDELWNVATSDNPQRDFISAAPLAYRDLVVTGMGNKGGGIGYIAAYDVKTGVQRWRFRTIPGPNEPGHDTWAGESWREGGAPTWLTGSYDPQLDLLLWAVGNPKPDYDKELRAGDNLYSNSVVALRGSTGELVWHFQFTPADDRDWDANQIPVLVDRPTQFGIEKLMLWANRNGFYYVVDRVSGKFLGATPYVHQTWTDGIDPNGRPLPRKGFVRNAAGYLQYPGNVGGTSWWSPSLDAERDLMFVPVLEQGMVFFPSVKSWPTASNRSFYTAVRALEARTGRLVWEYRRPPRNVDNEMGGVLTTNSGVLFGSDQSTFFALDSRTGAELWSVQTGGTIAAAPMTFEAEGQQFIAIASGRNLMVFSLPGTPGKPAVESRAGDTKRR